MRRHLPGRVGRHRRRFARRFRRKAGDREGPRGPSRLRGGAEHNLHRARLALRQHQRLGQDHVVQRQPLCRPQRQFRCAQGQHELARPRRNHLPVDPMLGQEGQRGNAEGCLTDRLATGGQMDHLIY